MSQSNSAKRPLTTLQKSTKKKVTVRLKNEVEYKGKMDNVDSYMNLIMTDAARISVKVGKIAEINDLARAYIQYLMPWKTRGVPWYSIPGL